MGFKAGVFAILLFISHVTATAASAGKSDRTCASLVKDLKAMQTAQKQLMASFIRKNDMMAQVLEQNASRLETQMAKQRSLKRSDLKALRVSAQTFRGHDEKEQALVARFEKASSQLLVQVQECLTNDPRSFKKLGQR